MKQESIIRCATVKQAKHLVGALPGSEEDVCSKCGAKILLAPSSVEHRNAGRGILMCCRCADKELETVTGPVAFVVDVAELQELRDRQDRRN